MPKKSIKPARRKAHVRSRLSYSAARLYQSAPANDNLPQVPPLLRLMGKVPTQPKVQNKPPVVPLDRQLGPPYEILMGEAGANLVLSKLMSWRVPACAATPGMAYDILADVEGQFYRIQVKTTTKMLRGRFTFMLHRGFHGSGKGMFDYAASDYDIAGLVCWPLGRVYFCAGPVQRVVITTERLQSDGFERQSWELAVALLKQRRAS